MTTESTVNPTPATMAATVSESPNPQGDRTMSNTNEKRYNGWTNYETWAVKLWMDNDEPSYNAVRAQAQEAWDDAAADETFSREERAKFDLVEVLKEEFEENAPDLGASPYADLLNAAMSEVNWSEIAENLLEDVDRTKAS